MKTFYVAFRRAGFSLLDRAIAFFDGHGHFCHAELLWPDRSKSFAIHAWVGCQYVDAPVYDPTQWVFVPIELDEGRVSAACDMIAGDKYDYFGCCRFLFKWLHPSHGRWFCTEGCAKIISVSGGPDLRRCYLIGPKELYQDLTGLAGLAKPCIT